MRHETKLQLEMPDDMQLHTGNSNSGAYSWTDIQEVEVIHTIFGKAKVRPVRRHSGIGRFVAGLLLVAAAAAALQMWFADKPEVEGTEAASAANPAEPESVTPSISDYTPPAPIVPAEQRRPREPSPAEVAAAPAKRLVQPVPVVRDGGQGGAPAVELAPAAIKPRVELAREAAKAAAPQQPAARRQPAPAASATQPAPASTQPAAGSARPVAASAVPMAPPAARPQAEPAPAAKAAVVSDAPPSDSPAVVSPTAQP